MSNFLAVATVTATMAQMIHAAAAAAVSGVSVTTKRPDAPSGAGATDPRVNVFLYQVTGNGAYRECDLPTRRADGTLAAQPQAALDLHYLVSFYGDDGELVPQRLLGRTVSAIHSQPVLSRDAIRDLIINTRYPHGADAYLNASDLADSPELIKFTPLPLNLEELSRLWQVFFQTTYTLSVAYQTSVVLIRPDLTTHPALPVRSRAVFARATQIPVISGIDPQILVFAPGAQSITLNGVNLAADTVSVRFAGRLEAAAVTVVSHQQIVAQLPAGLPAGVQTVQVVHGLDLGTNVEPHKSSRSNSAAFIFEPRIVSASFAKPLDPVTHQPTLTVTVQVDPQVGPRQGATLSLHTIPPAAPQSFSFASEGRAAPAASLAFAIGAVSPGDYMVRLTVDDAASELTVNNATGLFNGPPVTITP